MPISRSTAEVTASLRSALNQTLEDFEILIGDDGEHGDRTAELTWDPRVLYRLNSPPLGFVGNHEALLASAEGELIAFLHDDDRWDQQYLEQATVELQRSPKAGCVLSAHRETHASNPSPHPSAGFHERAVPLLLDERYRLLPSATIVRRAALADARRPWPNLSCGDMVMYLDIALAGWGVSVVEQALVHYSRHPAQISANETRFRRDLATLFELYHFNDPHDERQRRHRVAISRLSVGRADLKSGETAHARTNVKHALSAERSPHTLIEGTALLVLSLCPPLTRVVMRLWYRVRGTPPTARTTDA